MSDQKNQQPEGQKSSNELSDQDLEKVSGGTPPQTSTTVAQSAVNPNIGSGVTVQTPHP